MTIELKSNPASQLAEILEAFRNLAPKTNRAIDVWMKVLEADGQTVINKICELRLLIE
jgi:ribonuclease PH